MRREAVRQKLCRMVKRMRTVGFLVGAIPFAISLPVDQAALGQESYWDHSVTGGHVLSTQGQVTPAPSTLNRWGRWWGIGYSDGYHAPRYRPFDFHADLPPQPSWATAPNYVPHRHPDAAYEQPKNHYVSPDWLQPSPALVPSTVPSYPSPTPQVESQPLLLPQPQTQSQQKAQPKPTAPKPQSPPEVLPSEALPVPDEELSPNDTNANPYNAEPVLPEPTVPPVASPNSASPLNSNPLQEAIDALPPATDPLSGSLLEDQQQDPLQPPSLNTPAVPSGPSPLPAPSGTIDLLPPAADGGADLLQTQRVQPYLRGPAQTIYQPVQNQIPRPLIPIKGKTPRIAVPMPWHNGYQ